LARYRHRGHSLFHWNTWASSTRLQVQGETDTPAFSIDPIGRGVPLRTLFSSTVDGTDGEPIFIPCAPFSANRSSLQWQCRSRSEKQGHLITLDVIAPASSLARVLASPLNRKTAHVAPSS